MEDPNDTQGGKKDVKRTSGSARRIVVQDVDRDKTPKAIGRRLSTPSPDAQNRVPATPRSHLTNSAGATRARKNLINPRTMMIVGGIATVLVVIPAVALVLHAARNRQAPKQAAIETQTPASEATVQTAAANQSPSPQQSAEATPVETPSAEDLSIAIDAAQVRSMSLQLASQISQKSGYEFGPEFVQMIRERTLEFTSERSLIAARQYRHLINKSFRDEGLNPLIGYVLAMSRSKFDPVAVRKGLGLWQFPMSVARSQGYLSKDENADKLTVPETSAPIVASYTRQLLSTFEADDFMYAIACFGMDLQEAGRLQARLVTATPDGKSRRDIMKMVHAGVLSRDQVETIVQFFAAGIVGENPHQFGLSNPEPFSSLYY
jgi:hypothetical protein